MSYPQRLEEATKFLDAVYGGDPDEGHICIWRGGDKKSTFHTRVADAAETAIKASAEQDVYFRVCLLVKPVASGRGDAADTLSVPAAWADLDTAATHRGDGKTYPPDRASAESVLATAGPRCSALIGSGYGLHAYWIYREAWLLDTDAERAAAARLTKGWVGTLQAIARLSGWTMDSVGDLARVMRIPGTLNHKGQRPAPVELISPIDPRDGPRYNPDDIEQYTVADEYQHGAVVEVAPIVLRDVSVPQVHALLPQAPKFKKTWERKRTDLLDDSASGYDMAIASEGVYQGWSDQQILDAMSAWRRTHNEDLGKMGRRDYVTRTIGKARSTQQSAAVLAEAEQSAGSSDSVETNLDRLSKLFERRVLAWEQLVVEPPAYSITFGDPKLHIRVGTADVALAHGKFRRVMYDHGVLVKIPKKRWPIVAELLMRVVSTVHVPDGTCEARMNDWVDDYIRANAPYEDEKWSLGFERCAPIIRDGGLAIHMRHLKSWLASKHRERVGAGSLFGDLREAGFTPKTFSHGGTSRYYWIRRGEVQQSDPKDGKED